MQVQQLYRMQAVANDTASITASAAGGASFTDNSPVGRSLSALAAATGNAALQTFGGIQSVPGAPKSSAFAVIFILSVVVLTALFFVICRLLLKAEGLKVEGLTQGRGPHEGGG